MKLLNILGRQVAHDTSFVVRRADFGAFRPAKDRTERTWRDGLMKDIQTNSVAYLMIEMCLWTMQGRIRNGRLVQRLFRNDFFLFHADEFGQ